MQRREFIGLLGGDAASPCALPHEKTTGRRTMRAIGLVLLSIAITALLLTDADAKRRSSAQGSQAAGASRSWCATYGRKGISDNCSYATQQQCLAQVWGLGGFCRPNPFPGTAYGTGYTWSSRSVTLDCRQFGASRNGEGSRSCGREAAARVRPMSAFGVRVQLVTA